jgi:hypothetical protein
MRFSESDDDNLMAEATFFGGDGPNLLRGGEHRQIIDIFGKKLDAIDF